LPLHSLALRTTGIFGIRNSAGAALYNVPQKSTATVRMAAQTWELDTMELTALGRTF
jgi:hypothetical protein